MNNQNPGEAKPISNVENREGEKIIGMREQHQHSSVVGEKPARGKVKVRVKGGEFIERQFQRRNNINSLPGLIREHARLIQMIRNGEIPLDRGEVLSRAYGRHKEMVSALEQRNQLAAIQEQLRALRGDPSPQLLLDEAREAMK